MKSFLLLCLSGLVLLLACTGKKVASTEKNKKEKPTAVQWVKFEELASLQAKEPRKVFIDVYTDWCGWCKKMDAQTLTHPVIIGYMSEKYYAVKFNAETRDTIRFNGFTYTSTNPSNPRATHQLALSLLNNKLGYPSSVYLDEDMKMMGVLQTYLDAPTFEAVLHYYAEGANKTTPWQQYFENFNGEIK